ncbi:MAG: hypothetical protein EXS40_02945 [Opitutaceae bacterium]|nr:hypothetical protein [Opitutaceae bacterium]
MTFLRLHRPGPTRRPTLLGRGVACLAVGLLGLLVWLAADPEAHEFFHPPQVACAACGHAHAAPLPEPAPADEGDHHCIVTDFAAGCTDLAVFAVFAFAGLRLAARGVSAVSFVAPRAPRHRHAPSCGPPLAA